MPNCRNISQTGIKSANIFIPRPSEICPNLDIWFEHIPSGNPVHEPENFQCDRECFLTTKMFYKIDQSGHTENGALHMYAQTRRTATRVNINYTATTATTY
jgi:hypothetical protein